MVNRLDLQTKLEELINSRNVYYQPPETLKLNYPCIVYEFAGITNKKASDSVYMSDKNYKVTYITSNPDDPIVEKISKETYFRYDRPYKSGNLYHHVYTVYIRH